jgi:hypothetical protein
VSFDVTPDGDVTNVIAGLAGTVISISQRFPVDDGGRWDGAACGRGVCARMRGELGTVDATGTVEVTLADADADAESGAQVAEWRARRIAGHAF